MSTNNCFLDTQPRLFIDVLSWNHNWSLAVTTEIGRPSRHSLLTPFSYIWRFVLQGQDGVLEIKFVVRNEAVFTMGSGNYM